MFGDRSPAAAEHYLVITKEHIRESPRLLFYASYWFLKLQPASVPLIVHVSTSVSCCDEKLYSATHPFRQSKV